MGFSSANSPPLLLMEVRVKSSKTSVDSNLMASLSQVNKLAVLPFRLLELPEELLLLLCEDMLGLDVLLPVDPPAVAPLLPRGLNFSTVVDT